MFAANRRRFLAGLVAAAVPAGRAIPGEPVSPIKFAFSLYGMRSLTLEEALQVCAKIGYDGVELACLPDWPADPARLNKEQRGRLRARLRKLNLALPALMENLPLDVDDKAFRRLVDRARAAADLGRDLIGDTPPLIETILGGRVGEWDKVKQRFADRLAQLAQVMAPARTVLAVKPHRSMAMNLPEHALWLMEQVKSPWIKLAYDFSHFQFRDLTLAGTLQALLPHTVFVHVKDVRVTKGTAAFLLPGDGTIDHVALFRGLREGNYRGAVCVEVSGMLHTQKGYDPQAAARRSYQNLAPAFAKAGIRRR